LIRELALLLVVGLSATARAEDPPGPKVIDPTVVERARTPFEALTERLIGSASRAVRFDWRAKTAGVGVLGSGLFELNSFASARVGGFVRIPSGDFIIEFAFSRAIVWGSDSTAKLAQTPYRQAGRPNRFEIDFNVDYVLAEGVLTPRPGFMPPVQLVFSATAGFRYALYTEIWRNLTPGEVALAIFSPVLQQKEVDNLEISRLPAMQIDRGRYSLLLGFSLDIYFQPGLFISPRVMLALPVFSGVTASGLGSWWELTARLGWML
jgi:hypothetical protein